MATRPATPASRPGGPACGPARDAADEEVRSATVDRARPRALVVNLGLLAVVALPLVVALAVLANPRWYPIGDLAQTELRVREVGTADTPLVGLAGRIGPPEDPGSHPGPLSFYALAPGYRLLGSSPFALQVATAGLSLLAVGLAIGIARRRGGLLLALGTAAVLAVVVRSLGPRVVTEPWNPYLPVLWWVVVLLSVWSVWCDDDALLPVAVGAACLASQTHVPYAGLVAVVLGATALRLAWRAVRARQGAAGVRRPSGRAVVLSLLVGVVAWIPPVIDELTGDPGNMTVLVRYFLGSEGEPVGLRAGGSLWLSRLDPFTLLTGSLDGPIPGNRVVGAVFLAVWVTAAVVAWRRRETALVRLHQVTGLAALAGLVSMTRIYGALHYYLVLWAWSTTAVAVLAVVATVARAVGVGRARWPEARSRALSPDALESSLDGGKAPSRDAPVGAGRGSGSDSDVAMSDVGTSGIEGVGRSGSGDGGGRVGGVGRSGSGDGGGRVGGVGRSGSGDGGGRVGGGRPTGASAGAPLGGSRARVAAAVGLVVLVVASAVATVQALDATQSSSVYSEALAEVAPPTLDALEAGDVPGGGEGAYEVRADDPYVIGVQAYGLFTELLRAGVDARLPARLESAAGDHVVGPDQSLPVIVVATGPQVEVWRDRPEAVEVAATDPRSPEEASRQAALIASVQERLRAAGRSDQADQVERNLLVLAVDGDIPGDVRRDLSTIVDLGAPTAVFVAPAGTP